MGVRVDHARHDDPPAAVDDLGVRMRPAKLLPDPDRRDTRALDIDAGLLQNVSTLVHRDQPCIRENDTHFVRSVSSREEAWSLDESERV